MNSDNHAKKDLKIYGSSRAVPFSSQQNRILNIFFFGILGATFISMLAALLYYVYSYALLSAGIHDSDWLLGIFSDFVYIMNVSLEDSPYLVEDSSYPPVAIAVLYPFALICKGAFAQYSKSILTVDELTSAIVLHPEFWVAIILFFLVCSAAVIFALIYKFKLDLLQGIKLSVIVLCSAPFVYAVMRGNTIYFALIFLLLFLILYKSENPVLCEISYICLAISGLIKIYPLFFGVFLLHEKKIWASARVGIYTVCGFFSSFLLFKRGLGDVEHFIDNLSGFSGNQVRLDAGNNMSLTAMIYKIFGIFNEEPNLLRAYEITNLVCLILLFTVATFMAISAGSDLSRYILATVTVILIPSISYFYVLVFAIIPFMEFIRHYDELPRFKQRLYLWFFLFLLFTPLIITQFFLPHTIVLLTMFSIECVSVVKYDLLKKGDPLVHKG